ncbi:MAG: hypothetical protein N2557_08120 [Hydrogenophilus sp.]|nr:hypothetical protein [Hydrogenophilus sp.]
MGMRNASSVNAVIPYNRVAPDGALTIVLDYRSYDIAGRPQPVDPSEILLRVYKPDGTVMEFIYPFNNEPGKGEIERQWAGHYTAAVPIDMIGMWKWEVITNGGGGPSEDGQFEVVEAS